MSRIRGWLLYAVLLAVAVAFSLAAGSKARSDSPVPSVENPSGAGAKALFVFLRESGFDVRAAHQVLVPIADDVKSIVIASPSARVISADEVKSLQEFVARGGTLVVLSRQLARTQPHVDDWLQLETGPRPTGAEGTVDPKSSDPAGVTVETQLRAGLLKDVSSFRVGSNVSVRVKHPGALPVASKKDATIAWWLPSGQGEVWVFAGTDVLENRRIELADNLRFWTALASQGPVVFDEFHHSAAAPPPMSRGLLVLAAQLLVCFGLFAFARGARLGPPRPELVQRHRSMLEYLHSFAWLTRRARVEKELLRELYSRFRIGLHERMGIPVSLPDAEVARELEEHGMVTASEYLEAVRQLRTLESKERITPREFAGVSRRFAALSQ